MTHGTNTAYIGGCRCRPCKVAHAADQAKRRKAIAYGRYRPPQPVDAVAEHVDMLRAAGMSYRQIAAATGWKVTGYTTRAVANRRHQRVSATTADAILAVAPQAVAVSDKPGSLVDASTTVALLAAMKDMGATVQWIAEHAGVARSTVQRASAADRVMKRTAAAVYYLYTDVAAGRLHPPRQAEVLDDEFRRRVNRERQREQRARRAA